MSTSMLQVIPLPIMLGVSAKPSPRKPRCVASIVPSTRQKPLVFSSSVRALPDDELDDELDEELDEEELDDEELEELLELDEDELEELLPPDDPDPPQELSTKTAAHKNKERFTAPPIACGCTNAWPTYFN